MLDAMRLWICTFQKWQHDAIHTISSHDLLPFEDAVKLHHQRAYWIIYK